MTRRALVLAALLLLVTWVAPAQEDAFTSKKAKAAKQAFDRAWTGANKAHDAAVLAAERTYLHALNDAKKELIRTGDLEEARRVSDVTTWLEGNIAAQTGGAAADLVEDHRPLTAPAAVNSQKSYQAAVTAAAATVLNARTDALVAYHQALDAALTPVLQAGKDLDEAQRIQGAIRRVAAQIDGLKATKDWMVLFSSKEPADWDTSLDKPDRHAIPCSAAPREVRYLRLTRVDTGDAVIMAIGFDALRVNSAEGRFCWCGAKTVNEGGTHLGIDDEQLKLGFRDGGRIMISNGRSTSGWGFGHKVHANDTQYWAWAGQEIPPVAFEVAVTCRELNADERPKLLGGPPPDPLQGDGEIR